MIIVALWFFAVFAAPAVALAPPSPALVFKASVRNVTLPKGNPTIVVAETRIVVPHVVSALSVSIPKYAGEYLDVCLKRDVAPGKHSFEQWKNAAFCSLFVLKNDTANGHVAGTAKGMVRQGSYVVAVRSHRGLDKAISFDLDLDGVRCSADKIGGLLNKTVVCEEAMTLGVDAPVHAAVAANDTRTYVFTGDVTERTGALMFAVTPNQQPKKEQGSGRVLVRWGAEPTKTVFDLEIKLKRGSNKTVTGTIPSPQVAPWYVMVESGHQNTFEPTINVTMVTCEKNQAGPSCVNATMIDTPGAVSSFNMTEGDQVYFMLTRNSTRDHDNTTSLAVAVGWLSKLMGPDSDKAKLPTVLARLYKAPTAHTYDVIGTSVNNDQIMLTVDNTMVPTGQEDALWVVMVEAQENGTMGAWSTAGKVCANDCGEHGTCEKATLVCTCNKNFGSFTCDTKLSIMEPWEWALLIGGAVLIAIGFIGCIVCFIQKNQREASYEPIM